MGAEFLVSEHLWWPMSCVPAWAPVSVECLRHSSRRNMGSVGLSEAVTGIHPPHQEYKAPLLEEACRISPVPLYPNSTSHWYSYGPSTTQLSQKEALPFHRFHFFLFLEVPPNFLYEFGNCFLRYIFSTSTLPTISPEGSAAWK